MNDDLRPTSILVRVGVDAFLAENRHRRIEVETEGARRRVAIRLRRSALCCGFLEHGAEAMRLLHPSPDDIEAMAQSLRRLDIAPERLAAAPFSDRVVHVDLAALAAATAYPFPDDPNAEVCVVTGAKAYARRRASPAEIVGWYGSRVADMTSFVVVDDTLPVGPLCDEEIERAIVAGRIVEDVQVSRDELMDMPLAAVKALLVLGIERVDQAVENGRPGDIPVVYRSEDDDPLALPFVDGLVGRRGDHRIDVSGLGSLLEVMARARGTPYAPGQRRDEAVSRLAARLTTKDPMEHAFAVDDSPSPTA